MSYKNLLVLVACCYLLAQAAQAARILHVDTALVDYTLTKQETLKSILVKRKFPLDEWYDKVLKLNDLNRDSRLEVGQTILIPKEVVYFTEGPNHHTATDVIKHQDSGIQKSQTSMSYDNATYFHRVHLSLSNFQNSMSNGANANTPYNLGINYHFIHDQTLGRDEQDWQNFGFFAELGILSEADISRTQRDQEMDNTFRLQAFANYQVRSIINFKPFAEVTSLNNIVQLEGNTYGARTDRSLWAGLGLNKDLYVGSSLMNIELAFAHTLFSQEASNYDLTSLSGYRFSLKPEISIDENNFFTGLIEKSFYPANNVKSTTFSLGIGRFL